MKNRTFLVSVDVTSHGKYNIKRVVCRAYTNFYKDNSPIPSYYLREILRLILKENYFHFNGKHHRTAMGMHKDSSFLANIFMAYIETQILSYSWCWDTLSLNKRKPFHAETNSSEETFEERSISNWENAWCTEASERLPTQFERKGTIRNITHREESCAFPWQNTWGRLFKRSLS